jgi:hypothetical protein
MKYEGRKGKYVDASHISNLGASYNKPCRKKTGQNNNKYERMKPIIPVKRNTMTYTQSKTDLQCISTTTKNKEKKRIKRIVK